MYRESIEIYESFSNELRALIFKQGHLSQLKTIKEDIAALTSDLKNIFENAQKDVKAHQDILKVYQDFIYELIKKSIVRLQKHISILILEVIIKQQDP